MQSSFSALSSCSDSWAGWCKLDSLGAVNRPQLWFLHCGSHPLPTVQVLVADIHLDKCRGGTVASAFHTPKMAYRSFTCIQINSVWPVGTISTLPVSKNFPNIFSLSERTQVFHYRSLGDSIHSRFLVPLLSGWPIGRPVCEALFTVTLTKLTYCPLDYPAEVTLA